MKIQGYTIAAYSIKCSIDAVHQETLVAVVKLYKGTAIGYRQAWPLHYSSGIDICYPSCTTN